MKKHMIKSSALALSLGGALLTCQLAQAAVLSSSVDDIDGQGTTATVAPGATVIATVTATIDNDGTGGAIANWLSTSYSIDGGPDVCVDTGNNSGTPGGTAFTETLGVTAPGAAGTYTVTFDLWQNNTCSSANTEPVAGSGTLIVDAAAAPATAVPALGLVGTGLLAAGMAGLGFAGFRRRK